MIRWWPDSTIGCPRPLSGHSADWHSRSAGSRSRFVDTLENLVSEHRTAIFGPIGPDFRLLGLAVSQPLHRRGDRRHHLLQAQYRRRNGVATKKIWVKVRDEDLRPLFEFLTEIHRTMPEARELLPKPYFCCRTGRRGGSMMAMEFVSGTPLRNTLLLAAGYRRTAGLEPRFRDLGAKLRAFHDGSPCAGMKLVGQMADNARTVVRASPYLTGAARDEVIRHVDRAETTAGPRTELPLIKLHNDCILRNVLIAEDGGVRLIDLDSLRAPHNSRWYDIAYFLVSLESQSKYAPIVGEAGLARLWHAFAAGYAGPVLPDGLDAERLEAVLYIIKVEYLLGGNLRAPVFEMFDNLLGKRYRKRLSSSVLRGSSSILRPGLPSWALGAERDRTASASRIAKLH